MPEEKTPPEAPERQRQPERKQAEDNVSGGEADYEDTAPDAPTGNAVQAAVAERS